MTLTLKYLKTNQIFSKQTISDICCQIINLRIFNLYYSSFLIKIKFLLNFNKSLNILN